jgi:hypothetical protein
MQFIYASHLQTKKDIAMIGDVIIALNLQSLTKERDLVKVEVAFTLMASLMFMTPHLGHVMLF